VSAKVHPVFSPRLENAALSQATLSPTCMALEAMAMAAMVIWHGTEPETAALLAAVENNCACARGVAGERVGCCPAHAMLVEDQRALDGLLFVRRLAGRLRLEEECTPA